MDALNFTGKRVLVVGGSSGIGNGIAQAFRQNGAEVHVWGTRPSADDYRREEGSDLSGLAFMTVDMGDIGAIEAQSVPFSTLDALVLSQGTVIYRRGEYEMAGFAKVLDVNLTSLMACAVKLHAMLKASKGALITVSSTSAFHSTRGNPAYSASKAGAVGLTRTLADAWASDGIRVNGIAPGLVASKLTKVTTENPDRLRKALERIPMGRLGTPSDMAGVAMFLASPLASYVCGQTIIVDGGAMLTP